MQTQSIPDYLLGLRPLNLPLTHPEEQLLPVLLQNVGKKDKKCKEEKTDGDRGCNDDGLVGRS